MSRFLLCTGFATRKYCVISTHTLEIDGSCETFFSLVVYRVFILVFEMNILLVLCRTFSTFLAWYCEGFVEDNKINFL